MQKMNSRASLSKNGKCLSACSQVQPSFPLRQLTVLQKQTGAASMTLLLPLYKCRACSCDFLCMKGAHRGVVPFHALLPPFIQDKTHLRAAYTLVHMIHLQRYAPSIQVLYLCMLENYSYALQQMFYGSSVISTLHYYARGTDLISCSLSWQGMGVLLRQCAKPQMGREKECFSIALQWPLQLMMMLFCALMPFI